MEISNLFATCATIVALISAGGLGLQRSKVAGLRSDISDSARREEGLRNEIVDLQRRMSEKDRLDAEKDIEIAKLRSDLEYAQRIATGEVHWVALTDTLEIHHAAAQEAWRETHEQNEATHRYLGRIERKLDEKEHGP